MNEQRASIGSDPRAGAKDTIFHPKLFVQKNGNGDLHNNNNNNVAHDAPERVTIKLYNITLRRFALQ